MNNLISRSMTYLPLCLIIAWYATAPRVEGQEVESNSIRRAMAEIAEQYAAQIAKHGGGAVSIGAFVSTDPAGMELPKLEAPKANPPKTKTDQAPPAKESKPQDNDSNSEKRSVTRLVVATKGDVGPALQKIMSEELTRRKITIGDKDCAYNLTGQYEPIEDPPGALVVRITPQLTQAQTGKLLKIGPEQYTVFGEREVAMMLGLTTTVAATVEGGENANRFVSALKSPKAVLNGTTVRTTNESPFAVELLVKGGNGFVSKTPTVDKAGNVLAELKRNDIYKIRLHNRSNLEAAAEVMIDGINCFEFGKTDLRFWIVGPQKTLDVPGWVLSKEQTADFKVVGYPETAAARLKLASSSMGLITVSFAACWDKPTLRPKDELVAADFRGTGFGDSRAFQTQRVSRSIGRLRDVISIRYER